MARKVGQIIAGSDRRWLIRVYLGRDYEARKRKYHNRTIHGSMREAQAYLTRKLPEIVTPLLDNTDTLPPCGAIEALERQEPFINQTLAYQALAMLARLFRHGKLTYHGGFVNLASGRIAPLTTMSHERQARKLDIWGSTQPTRTKANRI